MIRKIIVAFLVIFLLAGQWTGSFAAAKPGTVYPQQTAALKKGIPATATPDTKTVLAIAEKYYKLAVLKATTEEKAILPMAIYWKPDFTGKTQNAAQALQLSLPSAYLAAYTNMKGFYLALNSAVFTLDIKSASAAGNLAASIAAYQEDLTGKSLGKSISLKVKDVQSYAADAAALYEYALALKLAGATMDASTMPFLLNYGYLCIDMGKLPAAKLLFETACKLIPDYLPAKEGMAAYWLSVGDKNKAKKMLDGAALPMLYKQIKKTGDDSSEKKAPTVEMTDTLASMENKLETLRQAPLVVATDFYADVDPVGTTKVRRYVDDLAKQWKYTSPGFSYLSEFSTLQAFSSGAGQAAFEGFIAELAEFTKKFVKAKGTAQSNALEGSDIDISVGGIDIKDILKNPEKYAGLDLGDNVSITGVDELINKAEDAQKGLASGDVSGALSLGASVAPEFAIFQMKPGDYANPTDLITQKYNMSILLRKLNGYTSYFFKMNKDATAILQQDAEILYNKLDGLNKSLEAELDKLSEEHEASHKGSGECSACISKTHAIHKKFDPQLNKVAESKFMDATNYMCVQYKQKFLPNIQAMYVESMKNCMLISDEKIRQKKEEDIKAAVYQAIFSFMSNVSVAYAMADSHYPYHCDCNEAEIAAAEALERKKFEEAEHQKTIMQNKARKEFEQGIIKESSQLYKNLDKYSTEASLMFMKAKWHPLKTELTFDVKAPIKGMDVGANYKMVQEHVRNTTTYGGGLSASVSGDVGKVNLSGSVSLQGEMTTDGNGNVVRADVSGSASGSASLGSYTASGTYEASVMRGCKLSGEVSKLTGDQIKPPNAVEAWDDYTQAIGVFLPEKPKKVLWQGEYQISK